MSEYQRLADEHLASCQVKRGRQEQIARKAHAWMFGVVEEQGLGILDMKRDDIKKLVTEKAIAYKSAMWLGFLILNSVIAWIVGKIVDRVLDWLVAKMEAWIRNNRHDQAMAVNGLMIELSAMFPDARGVVERP